MAWQAFTLSCSEVCTYANGLAGTMLVVALLVALLGTISLLLLVIGNQQQQADQGS